MTFDWERLYADHAHEILRFLVKLTGEREEASELMQETYVRAIRTGGRAGDIGSPRAWLFRIATNLARDRHRRRVLLRFVPFSGREVDPAALHDPETELVHRALSALPLAQATTLLLHYDGGFSRKEIASLHGLTEEAVKSRLARGRDRFAREYERVGGGRS